MEAKQTEPEYELSVEEAKRRLDAYPMERKEGNTIHVLSRPDAIQGLTQLFQPDLAAGTDNRNFDALILAIVSNDSKFLRDIKQAGLEHRLEQALKSDIVLDTLNYKSKAARLAALTRERSPVIGRRYTWKCGCKSAMSMSQAALASEQMSKGVLACAFCGARFHFDNEKEEWVRIVASPKVGSPGEKGGVSYTEFTVVQGR